MRARTWMDRARGLWPGRRSARDELLEVEPRALRRMARLARIAGVAVVAMGVLSILGSPRLGELGPAKGFFSLGLAGVLLGLGLSRPGRRSEARWAWGVSIGSVIGLILSAWLMGREGLPLAALVCVAGLMAAVTRIHHRLTRESESRRGLRERVVENLPSMIYILDPRKKRVIYVSSGAARVMGRSASELVGASPSLAAALAVSDDHARLPDSLAYDRLAEGEELHLEFHVEAPGGPRRLIQSREVVLDRSAEGLALRILGEARDVTEERREQERLSQSERRKEFFLATIAHEIRNPLAAIVNASEILNTPGLGDQHDWARRTVDHQARQLGRLADDLMDVARIERGILSLHCTLVDLGPVVRAAIDVVSARAREGGLELRVELSAAPMWMHGDASRIEQVVVNLLGNAIRYSDPGGLVRIRASQEGEWQTIRVRDHGRGIDPGDVERLFELFPSSDSVRARSRGGLSLGLPLVRLLTELHGGKVEARSEGLGQGSEFLARFPVAMPPGEVGGAARGPHRRLRGRIQIIDDNESMAQALAELLRLRGYVVKCSADARSGLEDAREFLPDIILLDLDLGDDDGIQAARSLRQVGELRDTRLVSMSGMDQQRHLDQASGLGFAAHLLKPIRSRELEVVVEGLVGRDGNGDRQSG